jgi:aryl-alcohol dehydrogenase (NADP+)
MTQQTLFALGGTLLGWTLNEKQSFEILDTFYFDLGQRYIDTADSYSQWHQGNLGGESETIIGNWLHSRQIPRDEIFLATKLGRKENRLGYSARNLRSALTESLARLRVDSVNLLYVHATHQVETVNEVVEVLEYFLKKGYVNEIGLSNAPLEKIQSFSNEFESRFGREIYAIQNHYNLIERDSTILPFDEYSKKTNFGMTSKIIPWLKSTKTYNFPYHSLCRGILTDRFVRERRINRESIHSERTAKYLRPNVLKIVDELGRIAIKHNATASAIALSWLRRDYQNTIPIISCNSKLQLLESCGEVFLDDDDFRRLDILKS